MIFTFNDVFSCNNKYILAEKQTKNEYNNMCLVVRTERWLLQRTSHIQQCLKRSFFYNITKDRIFFIKGVKTVIH